MNRFLILDGSGRRLEHPNKMLFRLEKAFTQCCAAVKRILKIRSPWRAWG